MTTDFRALCARMADELDYYRQLLMDDRRETHALATEARAALAEPQLEPPTDEEVTELAAWLRRSAGCADESPKDLRAADLLERQHFLTSQPPTDKELLHEWDLVPGARAYEEDVVGFARAVLARWGNYPESPDRSPTPMPVSKRLPGEEHCTTNPRTGEGQWCWGWLEHDPTPYSGRWRMMRRDWLADEATHWLPAHALPLPGEDISGGD